MKFRSLVDGTEYTTVGLGGATKGEWDELMLNPVGGEILPEARFVKLKCIEKATHRIRLQPIRV